MDSSAITAAWVRGWAVSRGTPAPIEEPWGYRIDVGLPRHVLRHVLPEPDERSVRELCASITEPDVWLKVLAGPDEAADWIPPGWTVPDDPGFMMYTELRATRPPALPAGYTREVDASDGVVRVRISAPDGSLAARGQTAPTGRTAVVDLIETCPGHQRKGLGRHVVRTLENAGFEAGARTGVLGATVEGRALYEALGWHHQGPLTGIVRT
ncbi:GNAT family N-acetyltransferase [Streptomyces sp. SP18CS02]|uniref:GNAT family N-acetyltransferase n=1 Tax=Streptomyces sp. SP18CS02 TaxID=3002531 RepID=UPI002E76B54C|nr:GNAT family N-acetyltransferase [Streptomyces sp. SP18CS02]MEE1757244.1 GNAT family N-acetyltransferase [Streptomyces sp. SP18CS02]